MTFKRRMCCSEIFNDNGELDNDHSASLDRGGVLRVLEGSRLNHLYISSGHREPRTYWTYKALCEAIAELLYIKQEVEQHPMFEGVPVLPEEVDEEEPDLPEEWDEPEEFPAEEVRPRPDLNFDDIMNAARERMRRAEEDNPF